MATLKIVNENKEETIKIDGTIASYIVGGEWECYSFYNGYISHETKAVYEDFFNEDADIVAVKYVGGGNFNILDPIALFSGLLTYAVYRATKKPKAPNYNASSETSSNNTIGGRGNEQRLGKRIEDIWGNDPQIFPSILSTYTRFDENRNEVECSILCAGRGNLSLSGAEENDYILADIPTTAVQVYQRLPSDTVNKALGGTIYESLTSADIKFPALSVKQNTTISGFELKNDETKTPYVFCSADYFPGTETDPPYYLVNPNNPPSVTVTSRSGGTATIILSSSVLDFISAGYLVGDSVTFTGFAIVIDFVPYNNCTVLSSSVTAVNTNDITINISFQSGGKLWDVLPLSTPTVMTFEYTDQYGSSAIAATGNVCSILNSTVFYSPITTVDFEGGSSATYLCNFECPQGTSTTNIARLRTYLSNGTSTIQDFPLTQDDQPQKRVGYTINLTFNTGATYPTKFTWERGSATTDSLVLRDVYKTTNIDSFYDNGVTLIRLERYYNSVYGGGSEMKLSFNATRYVYNVVEDSPTIWHLGTNYFPSADPEVYIPNLHLDMFNGRKTTTSLDYASLTSALKYQYGIYQGSLGVSQYRPVGGITFDESNMKYEEELKTILSSFDCEVFQIGSKIYTTFEHAGDINMQFTHRDIHPGTLKIQRVFRRANQNDGIKLTYKDEEGVTQTLQYPIGITLNNPLEIDLRAAHLLREAQLILYREWFKLKYQKKGCSFTATALGRQLAPGMIISVIDSTKETKSDGEIISTETIGGYLVATTSQTLPITISEVVITEEDGDVSTHAITRVNDNHFQFTVTPSVTIYTDWEQSKTRYQVYSGETDKYIVTDVDVKSYDEVEVTCVNYDARYYQYDLISNRPV